MLVKVEYVTKDRQRKEEEDGRRMRDEEKLRKKRGYDKQRGKNGGRIEVTG